GGMVSDASGSTIDLVSASITGGIVTLDGLLNGTGISAINGATINVDVTGTLETTGGTLTIDSAAPAATLTNAGTIEANGGELDITTE
ncbi:hypothetical protein, partial [Klebsiella pneumoniae]|uniref:hypothetical protein n=1 Tax=Klebsiella pneumoniae TaxID=573 RepID=UPI0030137E4A